MDSDDEDKVWFMSSEALRDVKAYLQVKKATGEVIEMPSGWMEGGVKHSHLRTERALLSSSALLTKKRVGTPEDNSEEAQKPKRRRSWPEIDPTYPSPTGVLSYATAEQRLTTATHVAYLRFHVHVSYLTFEMRLIQVMLLVVPAYNDREGMQNNGKTYQR